MSSSFPFHVKEHVVPGQHIRSWARGTANSQDDVLHMHVKQYIPKDNPNPRPGDVTIIGAHANGFPKELYEALWEDLYALSSRSDNDSDSTTKGGFRIRGIWIADITNQGYSGELNEQKLGNDPHWHDMSRDLLHLTNVFRSEMPRPIIGIGHSFGANVLTYLSLLHPRLFTSLILLDPTIIHFDSARPTGPGVSPARASTYRRDVWPSRAAAVESFSRSPFYQSWDPRVLAAWNQHAIRDLPTPLHPEVPPTGGATLRTTKHQEVLTFFRALYPHVTTDESTTPPTQTVSRSGAPDYDPLHVAPGTGTHKLAFYRSEGGLVLASLPSVLPSVLFVYGGTSDLSTPELRELRLSTCGVGPGGSGGVEAGRVAGVVMEGKGHLFPMEVPGESAEHAARWITREMARWREEEAEYEAWTKLPLREKMTLSQEFIDRVGRPESRPKKAESKL